MLRASGKAHDEEFDLSSITDGSDGNASGVPHGDLLVALAEGIVRGDQDALAASREAIRREMGDEELVDAISVAANFQRMVRIADGSGIPLDSFAMQITQDIRGELGLDHFEGSRNTPRLGFVKRKLSGLARLAIHRVAKKSAR